jgi:hypothetical protein
MPSQSFALEFEILQTHPFDCRARFSKKTLTTDRYFIAPSIGLDALA